MSDDVLDPDHDSLYIFNSQLRNLDYETQKFVVQNTLDFLDSVQASTQYSPGDLVYMRGIWKRIDKRVDEHAEKLART